MENGRKADERIVDPLDWNVMLRLPRSSKRRIERTARAGRTPVAVMLRSWVLERAAREDEALAARAAAKERAE